MKNDWKKNGSSKKGQGALEYLLLIGGAVLVATIVLLVIISSTGSTNDIINNNLGVYQSHVTLGATGGSGGNNCGNGNIDSGEQCDGANLNAQTCTTIPGGFTGGTLSCNSNCTFNTSACTSPPGSPPSFVAFSSATGTGSGEITVSWNVSGFSGSSQNEIKGFLTDPGVTLVNFDSQTADWSQSGISSSNSTAAATGLSVNTPYTFYMKSCNTNGCVLSSASTATSSKLAILLEAESFNSQTGLRTVPPLSSYSGGLAIARDGTTCLSGNGSAQYTINPGLNSPATVYVQLRAFRATAGTTNTVAVNGVSQTITPANPVDWRPTALPSALSFSLSGGSQTLTLDIPCTTDTVSIDKILLTTDPTCDAFNDAVTPANSGVNCT